MVLCCLITDLLTGLCFFNYLKQYVSVIMVFVYVYVRACVYVLCVCVCVCVCVLDKHELSVLTYPCYTVSHRP